MFQKWVITLLAGVLCAAVLAEDSVTATDFDIELMLINAPAFCGDQLTIHNHMLEENWFEHLRGLNLYLDTLTDFHAAAFIEVVKSLGAYDRWFDSGAGSFVALAEYLTRQRLHPRDKRPLPDVWGSFSPNLTGLVYRLPGEATTYLQAIKAAGALRRLSLLKDRLIENVPAGDIKTSRLITDILGPNAYARLPNLVWNKYFEVAPVGGHIFVAGYSLTTYVTLLEGGPPLLWARYLEKRLAGHHFFADFKHNTDPAVLHVQVTDKGPKRLPDLEEEKPLEAGQPPKRWLREIPPKGR